MGGEPVKRARQALMNLLLLAVTAACVLMLGPAALGYHRYVILTGSMTGTYDRGSIIFHKAVPTTSLKVGDPITYAPPPGTSSHDLVTHRISSIRQDSDGARLYRTKGDFNRYPDPWRFRLAAATQDRVAFGVPYVGFVFAALGIRKLRMALIGGPALLVAFVVLLGLWREAGEELRRGDDDRPAWGQVDHRGRPLGTLGTLPAARPVFVAVPAAAGGSPAHSYPLLGTRLRAWPCRCGSDRSQQRGAPTCRNDAA